MHLVDRSSSGVAAKSIPPPYTFIVLVSIVVHTDICIITFIQFLSFIIALSFSGSSILPVSCCGSSPSERPAQTDVRNRKVAVHPFPIHTYRISEMQDMICIPPIHDTDELGRSADKALCYAVAIHHPFFFNTFHRSNGLECCSSLPSSSCTKRCQSYCRCKRRARRRPWMGTKNILIQH